MESWRRLLAKSLSQPEKIAEALKIDLKEVKSVTDVYPVRINPYYLSLIKEKDDMIWKQCAPDPRELEDLEGNSDPLDEENQSHNKVVVHRYPDRVLLLVSNQCAMYCRFCTRKRRVGDLTKNIHPAEVLEGIQYIREHSEIRDVVISGGDPLLLSDEILEKYLKALRAIPHVEIVRIGTRVPCVLPQRITKKLCRMLKKYHPLYINTHFEHPSEITPESTKACAMLADAGIPIGNQSIVLKNLNDDPMVMKELFQRLLKIRVKPYYLYLCDPVKGIKHFRTGIEKGLAIIRAVKGHTSGLATPQFVVDSPVGKIPMVPQYVLENKNNVLKLQSTFCDKVVDYFEAE